MVGGILNVILGFKVRASNCGTESRAEKICPHLVYMLRHRCSQGSRVSHTFHWPKKIIRVKKVTALQEQQREQNFQISC